MGWSPAVTVTEPRTRGADDSYRLRVGVRGPFRRRSAGRGAVGPVLPAAVERPRGGGRSLRTLGRPPAPADRAGPAPVVTRPGGRDAGQGERRSGLHGRALDDRLRGRTRALRRDLRVRDLRQGRRPRRSADRDGSPPVRRSADHRRLLRRDRARRRHPVPRLRRRVEQGPGLLLRRRAAGQDGRPGAGLPDAAHGQHLRVPARRAARPGLPEAVHDRLHPGLPGSSGLRRACPCGQGRSGSPRCARCRSATRTRCRAWHAGGARARRPCGCRRSSRSPRPPAAAARA